MQCNYIIASEKAWRHSVFKDIVIPYRWLILISCCSWRASHCRCWRPWVPQQCCASCPRCIVCPWAMIPREFRRHWEAPGIFRRWCPAKIKLQIDFNHANQSIKPLLGGYCGGRLAIWMDTDEHRVSRDHWDLPRQRSPSIGHRAPARRILIAAASGRWILASC